MDITEQIAELRAKLEELERQTQEERQAQEERKPLLTGPCIAKTRSGDVVPVQRNFGRNYKFSYLPDDSSEETVLECGTYFLDNTDTINRDIVEVIRPLTEQEVLDWQFRGIEPDLSLASDLVAEGFEHSDLGRALAGRLGLVYLGWATGDRLVDVRGILYFFDPGNKEWASKEHNDVYRGGIYAYKPLGE